jgi:hypothetical protein
VTAARPAWAATMTPLIVDARRSIRRGSAAVERGRVPDTRRPGSEPPFRHDRVELSSVIDADELRRSPPVARMRQARRARRARRALRGQRVMVATVPRSRTQGP